MDKKSKAQEKIFCKKNEHMQLIERFLSINPIKTPSK